jgi:hypothetical protein
MLNSINKGVPMKNIWKWILGILVVVIVLGAVGSIAFMWRSHTSLAYGNFPSTRNWNNTPMMPGNDGWNDGPMMRNYNSPMMGRGSSPFFSPFFFIGGLLKVAFFGALLYGAYWLGRRNARVVVDTPSTTPEPAPKTDTSA